MENFSGPIMQPSDFHSHGRRNTIITIIIIAVIVFFLWKYKGTLFTPQTELSGLDPEKQAVLESVIKGKTPSDISVLTNVKNDGPMVVTRNNKIQPINQVSEYQKAIVLKSLLVK